MIAAMYRLDDFVCVCVCFFVLFLGIIFRLVHRALAGFSAPRTEAQGVIP